jgi:uncharacterized protein with beta-barrel porin domain
MPVLAGKRSVGDGISRLQSRLVTVLLAAAGWLAVAAPALADCQPDPAVSGQTVTCTATPPDNDGFRANPGVNQLTVNVLTDVTVQNIGGVVIRLRDDNTLTNNGTLNGGDDGTGIRVGDRNTMTNTESGVIRVGDAITSNVYGVRMGSDNVFTNLGLIEVGSLVGCGCGIEIGGITAGSRNTIINAGPITGGDDAFGIMVNNRNVVTNSGSITMGLNGLGIGAGNRNRITNAAGATITIGDAAFGQAIGIAVDDRNRIINNGAITLGNTSFGSAIGIAAGDRNRIVNNGAITLGSSDLTGPVAGIFTFDNNRITNNGSINVGDFGYGISVGDSNRITNNGTVTVGAGVLFGGSPATAAVLLGSDNQFNNNGTIRAGANAASIASCGPCTSDNRVTNNGIVDGQIDLEGFNHSFTNNGLVTITDPGTLPGAVHLINGTYIQNASGTLALRVTPDTTPFSYDSMAVLATSVTDVAVLSGTLKAVVRPGLYQATQTYLDVFTFCSCFGGVITGTFDNVVSSSPFFTATASYNPNSVDLTLTRIAFGSVPGETQNQRNVGNYLEQNYSPSLTGNAATFFSNLFAATSLSALDSLSGEGTTAGQQAAFNIATMFTTTMFDQMLSWLGGGGFGGDDLNPASPLLQYAAADKPQRPEYKAFSAIRPEAGAFRRQPWRAWMTAFGGTQSFSGDAVIGSASSSNRIFGAAGGIDYQVNPNLLVGLAGAGSNSSFSVPRRATSGTLDGAHIGVYGAYRWGAAYVAGTLSYSHFNNLTSRTIAGVGPTETAIGNFGSDQLGGRLQVGYKFAFDRFAVTPFAAVQYTQLRQQAYSEASFVAGGAPGILGLNVQARSVSSLPTFLGAQVDTRVAVPYGMTWVPFVRASWVHEFMPDRSIAAAMGILPTDAARIEAGSNLYLLQNVSLFGKFVGEYSAHASSSAGNGGLRVTW